MRAKGNLPGACECAGGRNVEVNDLRGGVSGGIRAAGRSEWGGDACDGGHGGVKGGFDSAQARFGLPAVEGGAVVLQAKGDARGRWRGSAAEEQMWSV